MLRVDLQLELLSLGLTAITVHLGVDLVGCIDRLRCVLERAEVCKSFVVEGEVEGPADIRLNLLRVIQAPLLLYHLVEKLPFGLEHNLGRLV